MVSMYSSGIVEFVIEFKFICFKIFVLGEIEIFSCIFICAISTAIESRERIAESKVCVELKR